MMYEVTLPNVPAIRMEVVVPNREFDFFIEQPVAPVVFEVNMGAESSTDLSLLFQISLL
jgi:hypothetical protein